MSSQRPSPTALRVSELSQNSATAFDLRPDRAEMDALAQALGLDGLRKLRFAGQIAGVGRADWQLRGTLGATVVQPCVVTLDPVTTRIEAPVERLFLRDFEAPDDPEVEMEADDDRTEPLGSWIDPAQIMAEALALNLPLYPRSDGAALEQSNFAEKGVAPMTDEDARPFAGLAALKDQFKGGSDPDD